MNEKEFMKNLWDVLHGNTTYITLEQFREKYDPLFVQVDYDTKSIRLMDDHNEWHLTLQKVWCDETMA